MNLDELKSQWEAHDAKLDRVLRLNLRLLQAPALNQAETAMRRLAVWLAVEVVLNLVAIAWLGSFLASHVGEPRFLLSALVLHLSAILATIGAVHQIVTIRRLDWSAPVVAIQKQLETLRVQRLRAVLGTFLLAPLLWTLFLIVGLEGLLGVDAFVTFPLAWLFANIALGMLVVAVGLWIARRYASRMRRSPRLQSFLRDLGGHNLAAADRYLHTLTQFEAEQN